MGDAILRMRDVKARTGLSRSEVYRREALGLFPKRVVLGSRCVGWSSDEISAWIKERIRETRKAQGVAVEPSDSVAA